MIELLPLSPSGTPYHSWAIRTFWTIQSPGVLVLMGFLLLLLGLHWKRGGFGGHETTIHGSTLINLYALLAVAYLVPGVLVYVPMSAIRRPYYLFREDVGDPQLQLLWALYAVVLCGLGFFLYTRLHREAREPVSEIRSDV